MILNHQYEIKEKLAEGAKGAFFSAFNQKSGSNCLVKAYRSFSKVEDYRGIQEEIDSLKKIKDNAPPILLKVLDVFEENKAWYAIFEEIKGVPLMKAFSPLKGQLSSEETLRYFLELVDGISILEKENENLRITSLSPENIILTGEEIKILDFEQDLVLEGNLSPLENTHFLSEQEVLERLGRILYFLLTRETPPFSLSNWRDPREFNPGLHPGLLSILRKCVDPRPEKRFQNLGNLQAELRSPDLLKQKEREKKQADLLIPLSQILPQGEKKEIPAWKAILAIPILLGFLFLIKYSFNFLFSSPSNSSLKKFAVQEKTLCAAIPKGIGWFNLKTGKEIKFFPLAGNFNDLIPVPSLQEFIVTDSNSNSAFLVNPNQAENRWHLIFDGAVKAIVFKASDGLIYVCSGEDRQIVQTTLEAGGVFSSTIHFLYPPVRLILNPSGKKLYIASRHDLSLRVLDTNANSVEKLSTFPEPPVLLYAGESRLAVYLPQSQVLEVLTVSGNPISSFPIDLSKESQMIFFPPHTGIIWSHGKSLRILNLKLGQMIQRIRLSFSPFLAVKDPGTRKFFMAGKRGGIYLFSLENPDSPQKIFVLPGVSALSVWDP